MGSLNLGGEAPVDLGPVSETAFQVRAPAVRVTQVRYAAGVLPSRGDRGEPKRSLVGRHGRECHFGPRLVPGVIECQGCQYVVALLRRNESFQGPSWWELISVYRAEPKANGTVIQFDACDAALHVIHGATNLVLHADGDVACSLVDRHVRREEVDSAVNGVAVAH